jgi:hypothetical protein
MVQFKLLERRQLREQRRVWLLVYPLLKLFGLLQSAVDIYRACEVVIKLHKLLFGIQIDQHKN